MKLAICIIAACCCVGLAGCAHSTAQGGGEAAALGGSSSDQAQSQDEGMTGLDNSDYRNVLSDPGPF